MNRKNPQAFSIVELSFVLLVIGLLVLLTLAGKQMIANTALAKAQSLTASSSVGGIEDLVMWFETTSDKSFLSSEVVDGGSVSQWNDINPRLTIAKTLTASGTARPTYSASGGPSGLPVLSFDGTSDTFSRANTVGYDFTNGNETTIFVVSKVLTPLQAEAIIFWSAGSNVYFNVIAPWNDNNIYWDFGVCCSPVGRVPVTMPPNFMNKWNIASYIKRADGSNDISINGLSIASPGGMTSTISLQSSATLYVGSYNNANFHKGSIAEIIIYGRALSPDERDQVTMYLSRKWNIPVR